MKYRYLPMTIEDKEDMLSFLGIEDVNELFSDIPEEIRLKGKLNIPEALSEPETVRHFNRLAGKNVNSMEYAYFLGAGIYDHYIPSTVNHVISRSEFYTAYTPYQPEISQGELQAIFEFQTMICELTGMEVANSSMYDGPTALAEAANLAVGGAKGKKVVISRAVHPEARAILQVNAKGQNYEVVEVDVKNGKTDLQALEEAVDESVAAVIVQYPNFFGTIEDVAAIEEIAHKHKGLLVVSSNPLALGVLQPPGAFGADIVVGDAQPFGIPMQFGGPSCGYFAVREKLMRKIPGRIVGQTVDQEGRRGFVLTLQAREQHIRREKATSNICSNQALNALAASVAMSALGKQGVQEVAWLNVQKSQYAKNQITALDRYEIAFDVPVFNEFVIKVPGSVADINRKLLEQKIVGGYDLGRDYPELAGHMLLAVTEMRTKEEIDSLVQGLEEIGRA
ncbi:aminomethyl-transferring glycine dehydrogenase subunit GcvPA [Aneurinibacillus migulanus]|uniref:Probable glycine dehydrogenase (decarboxylating) subunit 1 n=1 Tax=Aneurinibacillus migulanus TaxID=47500 RepID=A0A0D1WJJ1_ANEMI|nr:aminomethyl-transferring glycine dehydrogenase subunit GcvPA [Aneurinibacillus migulanus]KIV58785.1 glycine dehydrogenase [Aneurinibacillus migulanus]KON96476.1 glycine dehydrogenase [Aneurinibacillus migulanus]MED0892439.1 aminomethyl-transferring glycine dehydrogenase subunit GcvPA [Aneurinibacillus migulanus]MED1615608.1 aminomethyl-transferring glycine dehydrogenase subunit GcvPA [Aneurinibacillus migulanus]SDI19036.1 glycine dehydrogenase subunit 1 [Aneurinibacillus migulanus]